jgi:hypothetical protein
VRETVLGSCCCCCCCPRCCCFCCCCRCRARSLPPCGRVYYMLTSRCCIQLSGVWQLLVAPAWACAPAPALHRHLSCTCCCCRCCRYVPTRGTLYRLSCQLLLLLLEEVHQVLPVLSHQQAEGRVCAMIRCLLWRLLQWRCLHTCGLLILASE